MQTLLKTEAIVLRIAPHSKTSHIVTWLTRDFGLLATVVKGACRPKSVFLGQYDLFYTCEIVFYAGKGGPLHNIRECSPLVFRSHLRTAWRANLAAGYLIDLTRQLLHPGEKTDSIFTALAAALDALGTNDPTGLVNRYELYLLRELGHLPKVSPCPECRAERKQWYRFAPASGVFVCDHAPRSETTVSLDAATAEHFAAFVESVWNGRREKPAPSASASLGVSRIIGVFLNFCFDGTPASRRVLFEMLNDPTTQRTSA